MAMAQRRTVTRLFMWKAKELSTTYNLYADVDSLIKRSGDICLFLYTDYLRAQIEIQNSGVITNSTIVLLFNFRISCISVEERRSDFFVKRWSKRKILLEYVTRFFPILFCFWNKCRISWILNIFLELLKILQLFISEIGEK